VEKRRGEGNPEGEIGKEKLPLVVWQGIFGLGEAVAQACKVPKSCEGWVKESLPK